LEGDHECWHYSGCGDLRVSTAPKPDTEKLSCGESTSVEDHWTKWHFWPPLFSLFCEQSPQALAGWIMISGHEEGAVGMLQFGV
jgi:hypothetical protein